MIKSDTEEVSLRMSPEETHPWLKFAFDLERKGSSRLWFLLGEAQSKIGHVSGSVLHPGTEKQLLSIYLAKGAHGTTAIEGNTLTEEDAIKIAEQSLTVPPSQEYLKQEIENILDAANAITKQVLVDGRQEISQELLKGWNAAVLANGVPHLPSAVPGEYRRHAVSAGGYSAVKWQDCPALMERLCRWLNGEALRSQRDGIAYSIVRAALAHLYFVWIHPFGDGNGRTARLLESYILLSAGVPLISSQLPSDHYNRTRSRYLSVLQEASRSGGDAVPFLEYAVEGLVDGLKSQIENIRGQQILFAWHSFVDSRLARFSGPFHDRLRALERFITTATLRSNSAPLPTNAIKTDVGIAAIYSGHKTDRALLRDLRRLIDLRILKKGAGGYQANIGILSAFLPLKAHADDR